jgi:hypothetical protein
LEAEEVIRAVFEALGIDPELAIKRVKPSKVSRGRALAAWIWVERMGRSQVMVADAMCVRRTAVSGMLSTLRRDGLSGEEKKLVDRVFERLTGEYKSVESSAETGRDRTEPKIIVLKRNRKK